MENRANELLARACRGVKRISRRLAWRHVKERDLVRWTVAGLAESAEYGRCQKASLTWALAIAGRVPDSKYWKRWRAHKLNPERL